MSDLIHWLLSRELPSLEKRLGQPVVIENRGGAGGNLGTDAVAKSAPDGYTIGFSAAGALTVNPSLMEKMPYSVEKDLIPMPCSTRWAASRRRWCRIAAAAR
jgi:tripartite-type tricarboxylate transporter receptor subunit TctC